MIYFPFLTVLCAQSALTVHDIRDYDLNQVINLFQNLAEFGPTDVEDQDITFYLFTRNISNLQLSIDTNTSIDTAKNSKIIIHGYMDNHNRSWYHHLTTEYLKKGDFNVIQLDWWRIARSFYLSSVQNTKIVGAYLAKFILNKNIPLKKIHLIGHSLGAHIAAFAAQTIYNKTGVKISRITALDPAGPGFREVFPENKNLLSPRDADIVDVFHTDGGFFGYYKPLGTFDVYINGGVRIQPDCVLDLTTISSPGQLFEDTFCSHTRSYVRFTEIINDVQYSCKKCSSWIKYMTRLCDSNDYYSFGAEDINENMRGVCFVNTFNQN